MKITNNQNLPLPVFNAVSKQYHKGADYSITELIAPIQLTQLKREHYEEIEEDASDRIWALIGSAVHSILEKGGDKNALTEQYLTATIDGVKISGMPDYFDGHTLQDWKVVSVWSIIHGGRDDDYIRQLNGYKWLFALNGFDVQKLQIVSIIRDWSKREAQRDPAYPQSQIVIKDYPVLPIEETGKWIKERLTLLKGVAPNCTDSEMWAKKPIWAVMKEGRKSSLKNCDSESSAKAYLEETKGNCFIQFRPGERVRCEDYCSVNKWCLQYKLYQKAIKEAGK